MKNKQLILKEINNCQNAIIELKNIITKDFLDSFTKMTIATKIVYLQTNITICEMLIKLEQEKNNIERIE